MSNSEKSPAEMGAEAAAPDTETVEETEMTQTTDTDMTGLKAELNTILAGSDPMKNIHARHEGGTQYTVLSARNGAATLHWCDVSERTCTCEDMQYNTEGNEVCAHLVAAFLSDRMDTDELLAQEAINRVAQLGNAVDRAEAAADNLDEALVRGREMDAESREPSSAPEVSDRELELHQKADELQSAFDETVVGMDVQVHDGAIWVNKTPGAPDYTFDAFLSGPERMQYDPDNGPGEYWKNYIEPGDVSTYIEEVLE